MERPAGGRKSRDDTRQEKIDATGFGTLSVPAARRPPSVPPRPFGLEDLKIGLNVEFHKRAEMLICHKAAGAGAKPTTSTVKWMLAHSRVTAEQLHIADISFGSFFGTRE